MARDAMTQSSDSQNPAAPKPRPARRVYWLTQAALEELEASREDIQAVLPPAPPSGPDYGDF